MLMCQPHFFAFGGLWQLVVPTQFQLVPPWGENSFLGVTDEKWLYALEGRKVKPYPKNKQTGAKNVRRDGMKVHNSSS